MEQGQARKRAREISELTGNIHVADVVKPATNGSWTRGGWPDVNQTWAVFNFNTGDLVELYVSDSQPTTKREADDLTYGPGEEENDEADEA
jgi:hypothetical protein